MWPFKKKDKEYINEPALTIERKVHDWLNSHQQYIPVSVSFCPSGITGVLYGIIIYKYEVK